ncbi:MAG: hypothetical protein ACJ71N_07015 [Terriglobales bacterium]|jgi:hypothetical protein
MRIPRLSSALLVGFVLLAIAAPAKDKKSFDPPSAYHANSYPARTYDEQNHITLAADPYDTPDKASVFAGDYASSGLMPVRLIISNDGDVPIALTDLKLEFVTANRDKLAPQRTEDILRRLSRTDTRPDERIEVPLPIPHRKQKRAVKQEVEDEIQRAQFMAKAVEPHSTQSGFLFFDVSGIRNPLAGANLYVSGIHNSKGEELIYFEIPMEKYLSYTPPAQPQK